MPLLTTSFSFSLAPQTDGYEKSVSLASQHHEKLLTTTIWKPKTILKLKKENYKCIQGRAVRLINLKSELDLLSQGIFFSFKVKLIFFLHACRLCANTTYCKVCPKAVFATDCSTTNLFQHLTNTTNQSWSSALFYGLYRRMEDMSIGSTCCYAN